MNGGARDPGPARDRFARILRWTGGWSRAAIVRLVIGVAALVALTAAVGWVTHRWVGQAIRQRVADELSGTLTTAVGGLETWLEEVMRVAETAAGDPQVAGAVILLRQSRRGRAAEPPQAGGAAGFTPIEQALLPYLRAGAFAGFALLEEGGQPLAHSGGRSADELWSQPDPALGRRLSASLRAGTGPGASPGPGHAVFVPPFRPDGRRVITLVLVPVTSPTGQIAALAFEVSLARFSRVLQVARPGSSGETYAFDADGNLLSGSRFEAQLRRLGMLAPDDAGPALVVSLRDPGADLTRGQTPRWSRREQPLTAMAARAIASKAGGVDTAGYRDYRGVEVVGAWTWLSRFGFGVTTEADSAEAFGPLARLQRIVVALVVLIAACGVALVLAVLAMGRIRARAAAAEQRMAELGQYRLTRQLGEGGMGTVYLATHALLRRPTAVKLLRTDRTGAEFVARFEREARATSELCHPNTVALYDYGRTADGTCYYAMEYLEGFTLEQLVRRHGPLPAGRVIHVLRQVCASLMEAHGRGLVHRDLKPANIFLCNRAGVPDLVKVLDFGLARWYQDDQSTAEGRTLIGTPEYLAPELFDSADAASPRSDLYALGALGYFLLTARPVFEGDSLAALCTAHLTRAPVPPSDRLGARVDPALERVILGCLAKTPEARPASAEALRWLLGSSPEAQTWKDEEARAWWAAHPGEPGPEGPAVRQTQISIVPQAIGGLIRRGAV